MTYPKLKLVSHHLCPYVQRASIALLEKNVPFKRVNIDLSNKPDWFLKLSPLGKVPILVVDDDTVLFESSAIAQYINDISGGGLLSVEPLEKSRELAWMEFASQVIANIGRLYGAENQTAFDRTRAELEEKFQRVEEAIDGGPWFTGPSFSLVDAAFAPAFRYFNVIGELSRIDFFAAVPRVSRWRHSMLSRKSVVDVVSEDYPERLLTFFANRNSIIGRFAQTKIAARKAA